MKTPVKTLLAAIALAVAPFAAADSGEAPLWLRNAALSPDGSLLAFTYKGDIYTVPPAGGQARQLTTSPAYDTAPVWSPDSRSIAFASDRRGSLDIYVMPAAGGTARRLTTHSGSEMPLAWLNDTTVLFDTRRMPSALTSLHPKARQVYSVTTTGTPGSDRLWRSVPMGAIAVGPGGAVAYQDRKGVEDPLRKHERSSGTADIWTIGPDGRHKRITSFEGHDLCPAWAPDGTLRYISEADGTLNIWAMNADGSSRRQLTRLKDHPVRSLTCARTGLMAFSWRGELYTMAPGAEAPTRVPVTIVADDYNADHQRSLRTDGATCMSPSPDGSEVAFVMRGDVYVTSVKYKTTRRVTDTDGQERNVHFSPDGRSLVYDGERDGQWAIYKASLPKDAPKGQIVYAPALEETLLYRAPSGVAAQQPAFSPDGKSVAFLEDRTTLRVIAADGTGSPLTVLGGEYNYSYTDGDVEYAWSPDSRWLLASYIGNGGWNNRDIALVKADGTQTVNLTESGYSDSNPHWAMGGRAVVWDSSRYGMRSHGSWGEQGDVMFMALDPTAWHDLHRTDEEADRDKEALKDKDNETKEGKNAPKDKKAKTKKTAEDGDGDAIPTVEPLQFDLGGRRWRTERLTGRSASMGDFWLDGDGEKLYYVAGSTEGGRNLYCRSLRKGETKVLTPGLGGQLTPDAKGENLYVLSGSMSRVGVKDGKKESIDFEAPYDRHPSREREYIYRHMLSQVRDKFHDKDLHGVDWEKYGREYERFLPHIDNGYDFADMLSEILGELNASHTGATYYGTGAPMATASLGAFFDGGYCGPGLKVAEVLPAGPLGAPRIPVAPGDIITAIDGQPIAPGADTNPLLEGKAGRPVRLTVTRAATGMTDDVTVRPVSQGDLSTLLYRRWVARNEARVDSLSGGRVAYVHVQGMDSPSFREVYSRLLGRYRGCEAVVVDTRWNGGGWLHNDLAQLLSGKEYVRYCPRGRYIGSDPFMQWTKPSAMLVGEANYSDAHGTPYTYQTLGIGPVIGAPVPGTMTAVWWETQVDPSIIFGIPQVTSVDSSGHALENRQLTPDITVYNDPADCEAGRDAQLEAAVAHLLGVIGQNAGK